MRRGLGLTFALVGICTTHQIRKRETKKSQADFALPEYPCLMYLRRQLGILRMVYSAAEIGAMEAAMYRASSGLSMLSSSSQAPNIRGLRFDL